MVDGNKPVSDNDWGTITKGGDAKIKKWIADQLDGRSRTIVLVGSKTAGRKWIDYEIIEAWKDGMGVVGIHIHGLKNLDGKIATTLRVRQHEEIRLDQKEFGGCGRRSA